MTAKHYASADSIANARASQVSRALTPKADPLPANDPVATFLSSLTPEQLADLKSRLIS
jgi:hypothetical protein